MYTLSKMLKYNARYYFLQYKVEYKFEYNDTVFNSIKCYFLWYKVNTLY